MNEFEMLRTFAMNEQKELEEKIKLLKNQLKNDKISEEEHKKKKQELDDLIAISIAMQQNIKG